MELVGRRFLCASGGDQLEQSGVAHWGWRAGLIRAVSTRDTDSPALTVYVEWIGESTAEQYWSRIREEWKVFVVEYEPVWARRSNTSQENSSLQPAVVFRPLVGESHVGELAVVEFLSDRQREFYINRDDIHPYEGEVDSDHAASREDPTGSEQFQNWLRQSQLQHILQQGHSCVKGLRVKVFRPDCKPHWLYGVISNYDQNNKTMTVLSDQAAEPVIVDPLLVHVLFLDENVSSLLIEEKYTSKDKPQSNDISRTTMITENGSSNTLATEQACVSGPMQRNPSELCSQNSICSFSDEKGNMCEQRRADEAQAVLVPIPDSAKTSTHHGEKKRRNTGQEEEQKDSANTGAWLKRQKGDSGSETSSNNSEGNNSQSTNLPGKYRSMKRQTDCEMAHSPSVQIMGNRMAQSFLKSREPSPSPIPELAGHEVGNLSSQICLPSPSCNGAFQITKSLQCTLGKVCDKAKEETRIGVVEMMDMCDGASQEDSQAVSALLASQQTEQLNSIETATALLHTPSLECNQANGEQEILTSDPQVKSSGLTHQDVITPSSEEVQVVPEVDFTNSNQMEEKNSGAVKISLSLKETNHETEAPLSSEIFHKTKDMNVRPSPGFFPEAISKLTKMSDVSNLKCTASPKAATGKEEISCQAEEKVSPKKALKGTATTEVDLTPTPQRPYTPSPNSSDSPDQSRISPQILNCIPAHTPTQYKPIRSPLIVDRPEPFTVYRDPVLINRELESLSSYIQPPNTPPKPHYKYHLNSLSPSSSPSLTSSSSHTKILSPTAHISPLPIPSQTSVCSTHPSIPHPHFLPSLLPGLPQTSSLLIGHTRLGPLNFPHHPIALQANQSLLGQSPGTNPMAPLGLYPFIWPPIQNGTPSYSLGLQASTKWTPQESAEMSGSNLRTNSPSPWLSQNSPVTSVDSQGLRSCLPVPPSSADSQRIGISTHSGTPTSKSTGEMERKVFTEAQGSIYNPLKNEQEMLRPLVGKNGLTSHLAATESSSTHSKRMKLELKYDLTGDRTSHYQEENRRILQESIEVAPFTTKLGSEREPRYPKNTAPSLHSKEREKEHDREMHMFRHSVPSKLQSAQPSPTLTQSSYYCGVENKTSTCRTPPNKELYKRLRDPNTSASVLPLLSTQGAVKVRPPALIKRRYETEEGLQVKITEQLASKIMPVEPLEHSTMAKKGLSTGLISVSASSPQLANTLHRAPIFHPPALPIIEARQGKISPPTPISTPPMSLSGKNQKQHRPSTLIPELKDGAVAGRLTPEPVSLTNQTFDFQSAGLPQTRGRVVGGHSTNGCVVNPLTTTASVIVRPTSYTDSSVNTNHDRSLCQTDCDHVHVFENVPRTHLKDGSGQCKRGVIWTPMNPVSMVTSKQDNNTPLNMTTKYKGTANCEVKYTVNANAPHSSIAVISKQCEEDEKDNKPRDLSTVSCCPPAGLPHVKKRRAGLPTSELNQNMHMVHRPHTTDSLNSSQCVSHNMYSNCTTHSKHTVCTAHPLDQAKDFVCSPSPPKQPRVATEVSGLIANKPDSLPVGASAHINQPAQSGQINYHKLKKAWLTRHSEQDKCSATSKTIGGSTFTNTASISQSTKPDINGLDSKLSTHGGKDSGQDNKKSKTLDRMTYEATTPIRSNTKCNTEASKPLAVDWKSEIMRPLLDRNGNLEGKVNSQNNQLCYNVRKSVSGLKTEKYKHREKPVFPFETESGKSGHESKSVSGLKRQSKPTFKKKQKDKQIKKGDIDNETEEETGEEENKEKPNGALQITKEKSHRLSGSGIPRSVLKDWRKVKKLKQSGEPFLQDDSCIEIGANVQKCRECRLDRSRKPQDPVLSPVFCRFYNFRRLSYSKNGVVRVDGFSVVEETTEEAVRVWMAGFEDEEELKKEMELDTAKYILTLIGDKFCQLVETENTAVTWVRKDSQVMWKRAVRGVREMCDACESTLFNMHWVCHKCGFVVCMDCFRGREMRSAKDKELYVWVRCVKNQPHDLKNLMPTQIVPETILSELQSSMHCIRREYGIPSQCSCYGSSPFLSRSPITNGLSQLSARAQCDLKSHNISPQIPSQQKSTQSMPHKIPIESKGKLKCDELELMGKMSNSPQQSSTLRDLLTSTAGKLRLGSTGPGLAFAPVYNNTNQTSQNPRVPNLLDDIIASVVENKIPAASKATKLGIMQDLLTEENREEAKVDTEEEKPREIPLAPSIPHEWIGSHRLLWLKDHRHLGNQRLFKENWTQEQPVLVSGLHKSLNNTLWRPEQFSREFSTHQSDFYNCRDGSIKNACIKEFWDGFEDVSKRPKSGKGDPAVYRLKDWPSGEEFLTLMPSRYEDFMRSLPVPEYTGPDGALNLASRLPSFFIRPDLGPRLCCAHGVTSCPEQDFGTSNLHAEISDTMSVLVYVGLAKGNDSFSQTGVLKLLEDETLDDSAKRRLKDPNDIPGALWHIYLSKDVHKIQEFLQMLSAERAEADAAPDSEPEWDSEVDPLRDGSWYLNPRLRQRLLQEHGVESRTMLQFYGDAVIIPAGAMHQVMNLNSCIQVNVDFVSPEHAHNSYYLTQELRLQKDQVNYEDKLQVKNIFYHSVKDAVAVLSRHLKEQSTKEIKEEEC